MSTTVIRRLVGPQDKRFTTMICPCGEKVVATPDPGRLGYMRATVHTQEALAFCLSRGWTKVPSAPKAVAAPKKRAPKKRAPKVKPSGDK